jgi:hypothetical protein
MSLHQHSAVEQLHQRRVRTGIQMAAEIGLGRRVGRPGDLDVFSELGSRLLPDDPLIILRV